MTTLPIRFWIGRLSPLRRGFFLSALVFVCLALSPTARAVVPAPDGGYPNGNTAEGANALQSLTTGNFNTALGNGALFSNTTGFQNAATGAGALLTNTTGFHNTADGIAALFSNTTGNHNTADGDLALARNTNGNFNTGSGAHALVSNTHGNLNIALGFFAGQNLTTGSNNIDISNGGVAAESNIIRIGNEVAFTDLEGEMHPAHTKTFIAGISGTTIPSGVGVVVDTNGQLGIAATSSQRFKDLIKPMDKASEAILALKPVTFHYKKDIDPKGTPQFGLVAGEVEKVNPALVTRDTKGEVYTVRYEAVNAMLLNEFLKEHQKVQELEKQVEKLTAGLQKVSAQVEMSRPVPRVVDSN
jgi:Chaperone of endosialidase